MDCPARKASKSIIPTSDSDFLIFYCINIYTVKILWDRAYFDTFHSSLLVAFTRAMGVASNRHSVPSIEAPEKCLYSSVILLGRRYTWDTGRSTPECTVSFGGLRRGLSSAGSPLVSSELKLN